MQITNRIEKEIEFHHLGHTYRVEIQKCYHPTSPSGKTNADSLMTPEMVCIREDCPECKRAAEERDILGYRTPAQTCFPLTGDSEAMEMHLRYRIQSGKSKKKALSGIKARLKGDKWAEERLAMAEEGVRK